MVVNGVAETEVDRLFQALAHFTRCDIVARALRAEQSVSALAVRYKISFAVVQKNVAVLERAQLVRKCRSGREQLVRAELRSLRRAARLLDSDEKLWRDRVHRITAPRRERR